VNFIGFKSSLDKFQQSTCFHDWRGGVPSRALWRFGLTIEVRHENCPLEERTDHPGPVIKMAGSSALINVAPVSYGDCKFSRLQVAGRCRDDLSLYFCTTTLLPVRGHHDLLSEKATGASVDKRLPGELVVFFTSI
jgi:hypothetical protein